MQALVRDPDKVRKLFGDPPGLAVRATALENPAGLTAALASAETLFIAMG